MFDEKPTQYECGDCDWVGVTDEMDAIDDVHERVSVMAAGHCPECGALISAADEDISNDVLESAIRLAVARGMLSNKGFKKINAALFMMASVSDHKVMRLTHDQLRNLVKDLRLAAQDALRLSYGSWYCINHTQR